MHHAIAENISACPFQRNFGEHQSRPIVCTRTGMGGSSCIYVEIHNNFQAKVLRMHTLLMSFIGHVSPFLLEEKKKKKGALADFAQAGWASLSCQWECLNASTSRSHCWTLRTPSPPGTLWPPSHSGYPGWGGAGAQGTWGEVEGSPCAQGAAETEQEVIPRKGAFSPPDPPSPTLGHLWGHRTPISPNSCIWPHTSAITTVVSWCHEPPHCLLFRALINTGTSAADPQFTKPQCPEISRMLVIKKSQRSKAGGCPPLCGAAETWLQEPWRKMRQHQTGDTISRMVAMSITHVADGVEPVEVDPPEDQEELMEVDPPPIWLIWYLYTVPGLPSMMRWRQHSRSARPVFHHPPSPQLRH